MTPLFACILLLARATSTLLANAAWHCFLTFPVSDFCFEDESQRIYNLYLYQTVATLFVGTSLLSVTKELIEVISVSVFNLQSSMMRLLLCGHDGSDDVHDGSFSELF